MIIYMSPGSGDRVLYGETESRSKKAVPELLVDSERAVVILKLLDEPQAVELDAAIAGDFTEILTGLHTISPLAVSDVLDCRWSEASVELEKLTTARLLDSHPYDDHDNRILSHAEAFTIYTPTPLGTKAAQEAQGLKLPDTWCIRRSGTIQGMRILTIEGFYEEYDDDEAFLRDLDALLGGSARFQDRDYVMRQKQGTDDFRTYKCWSSTEGGPSLREQAELLAKKRPELFRDFDMTLLAG